MKKKLHTIYLFAEKTIKKWLADKTPQAAAAVGFYTIFSLAPLVVIVLGITNIILSNEAAVRRQLIGKVDELVGPDGAQIVDTALRNFQEQGGGVLATVIGFATLLFGATTVFAQIQDQLNIVWKVKSKPGRDIFHFLWSRLVSLGIILILGFLLLVSLIIDAVLSALGAIVKANIPGVNGGLDVLNILGSFFIVTLLFSAIFKYLPDVVLRWKDVFWGGFITAVFFTIGKFLIGIYLGQSAFVSTYGAAGSLVIMLLWVYYSAQILFLGAEFTHVYVDMHKHYVGVKDHAERVE